MVLLAVVVVPLPALPITVAAGMVYGPVLGTLYAVGGALMGALGVTFTVHPCTRGHEPREGSDR